MPVDAELAGLVGGLTVEVVPVKPEILMDEPDGDAVQVIKDGSDAVNNQHTVFKVTVRVKNPTDSPLTNVHLEGDIGIGPIEEAAPGEPPFSNSQVAVDDPAIHLVYPEKLHQPKVPFGDLAPGETKELTYFLEALRPGTSSLDALVVGAGPGGTVAGVGTGRVKVLKDVKVELRVKVDPTEHGHRLAGQSVRIVGELENFSEEEIAVFPAVYYGDDGDQTGSRTRPTATCTPTTARSRRPRPCRRPSTSLPINR